MSAHTPGPWVASRRRFGNWDIETDDADIAEVNGFGDSDEGESDANARLIAAAPDLLEAAAAVAAHGMTDVQIFEAMPRLRAAIAKATQP